MQEAELCKSPLEILLIYLIITVQVFKLDRAVMIKFHISLSISYFYLFCSTGKWKNMFRKVNANLYFKLLLLQKLCIISFPWFMKFNSVSGFSSLTIIIAKSIFLSMSYVFLFLKFLALTVVLKDIYSWYFNCHAITESNQVYSESSTVIHL